MNEAQGRRRGRSAADKPSRTARRAGSPVHSWEQGLKRYLRWLFAQSETENHRQVLRLVRLHGPFERVLDLGCHDGAFSLQVGSAARARSVVGVELLPAHARRARQGNLPVALASLERPLPVVGQAFDLVHANQVIEHLRHTDLFLAEVARVTKPGGIAILSTNNLASWHNIFSLLLGYQPHPNHVSDRLHVGNPLNPRRRAPHADEGQTHLRIFTGRALVELADHHGLETVVLSSSGYYPFPPLLARLLARLDPRHAAFLIGVFRARTPLD